METTKYYLDGMEMSLPYLLSKIADILIASNKNGKKNNINIENISERLSKIGVTVFYANGRRYIVQKVEPQFVLEVNKYCN